MEPPVTAGTGIPSFPLRSGAGSPRAREALPDLRLALPRFPGMEESEQIDRRVTLERVVIRRPRYRKTCSCPGLPAIITAPPPSQADQKGYVHGRLHRQAARVEISIGHAHEPDQELSSHGGTHPCQRHPGRRHGGVIPFLEPLYSAICARNAASDRLKADETGWKVFTQTTGKKTHRWWLWVFASPDTAAFILSPSRSSEMPKNHLDIGQPDQDSSLERILRIMLTDFYSAYRVLKDVSCMPGAGRT